MLAYRGVAPRLVVQTQRVQGPPAPSQAQRQPDAAGHGEPAAPAAPELVDVTMFFDDYRTVDGVALPHHITRSIDGQTNEEWTFKTIKINPAFKPETFSKR